VEDTLSAWFRRLAAGQHPFTADRKHLHHKLLDWGLTPKQVVLLMYCATIVLGIIALLLMVGKLKKKIGLVVGTRPEAIKMAPVYLTLREFFEVDFHSHRTTQRNVLPRS